MITKHVTVTTIIIIEKEKSIDKKHQQKNRHNKTKTYACGKPYENKANMDTYITVWCVFINRFWLQYQKGNNNGTQPAACCPGLWPLRSDIWPEVNETLYSRQASSPLPVFLFVSIWLTSSRCAVIWPMNYPNCRWSGGSVFAFNW